MRIGQKIGVVGFGSTGRIIHAGFYLGRKADTPKGYALVRAGWLHSGTPCLEPIPRLVADVTGLNLCPDCWPNLPAPCGAMEA